MWNCYVFFFPFIEFNLFSFIHFFYRNITDINIFPTPQIGSHGHKKTPDCYTKGHSKVKNHVSIFSSFLFWLKHLLKESTVDPCRLYQSWILLLLRSCVILRCTKKKKKKPADFSVRSVQNLVISASMKQIVPLIAVKIWRWIPLRFREAVAIFIDTYWDTVRQCSHGREILIITKRFTFVSASGLSWSWDEDSGCRLCLMHCKLQKNMFKTKIDDIFPVF